MAHESTVEAKAVVACSGATARTRLVSAVETLSDPGRGSGLDGLHITVGPRRRRALFKEVAASLAPHREAGRSYVWRLSWKPTGHLHAAYPTLDADVLLTSINSTTSLLTVAGRYRPPLGPLGTTLDRVALHRLASATVAELTRRLGRALSTPSE